MVWDQTQFNRAGQSFFMALRLLTRLPLQGNERPDNGLLLLFFPVVGLVLGLVLWLLAAFLIYAVGPLTAAFLAAIGFPLLFWWLTEGRNLTGLIWAAGNWEMPEQLGHDEEHYRPFWIIVIVQAFFLARVAATGILIYTGHPLWLAVGTTMAMAAHAELLKESVLSPAQKAQPYWHWIIAGTIAILISGLLKGLPAGILALVLPLVLTPIFGRVVGANCGSNTEHGHAAIREVTEILVLLIGVLFFASQHPL